MKDTTFQNIQTQKTPFYRDTTVISWIAQVVALAGVLFTLFFLASQAGDTLRAGGFTTGYDFLGIDPGFYISEGIDTKPNTGGRALWVGMVNTIRLAIGGIISATILGVFVGIGRLSINPLIRRMTSIYIEIMRNVPLLVHIFLIAAVFGILPQLTLDQGPINSWVHLSNKGLSIPRVHISDGFYQWGVFVIIGVIAGMFVKQNRQNKQNNTGVETYPTLSLIATVAAFCVIFWWIHPIVGWLGSVFDTIAQAIYMIPKVAVQIIVSVASIVVAVLWIKRSIDRLRTPTGIVKLADTDYFRIIFAGILSVMVIVLITMVWPGLANWIVNSGSDLFGVLADKFGNGRTGNPIDVKLPDIVQVGKFTNYGPSGLNFTVGLAAVYFGVVLYTAAFIAEIVRGGILAVPKGQTEAAQAIGLRRSTMLRHVIIPQALRVILPPLGNQYLNLTKNTSLGIAVGYSELVSIGGTMLNQAGKELEIISIWMMFYLACSLTISVVVNFVNIRLKIVTR